MPIGLRRFLLNLSVIIIAFGAFLLYTRISYNNSLSIVEATVENMCLKAPRMLIL